MLCPRPSRFHKRSQLLETTSDRQGRPRAVPDDPTEVKLFPVRRWRSTRSVGRPTVIPPKSSPVMVLSSGHAAKRFYRMFLQKSVLGLTRGRRGEGKRAPRTSFTNICQSDRLI